jgi:hypothetical protein
MNTSRTPQVHTFFLELNELLAIACEFDWKNITLEQLWELSDEINEDDCTLARGQEVVEILANAGICYHLSHMDKADDIELAELSEENENEPVAPWQADISTTYHESVSEIDTDTQRIQLSTYKLMERKR